MVLIYYLLFVIAPIIFWLFFFSMEERSDPEPRKLLFLLFFLGMGLALFAMAVELTIGMLFSTKDISLQYTLTHNSLTISGTLFVVMAGFIEELLKYLTLNEFLYNNTHFNQIADGFFYAVTLALGFVLVENSGYFFTLYTQTASGIFIAASLLRGVLTSLLHITAAGITGYAMGRKKFSSAHSRKYILIGLSLAILLHATFNLLVSTPLGILFAFPLVVGSFIYLIIQINKPETKAIWRLVSNKEAKTLTQTPTETNKNL